MIVGSSPGNARSGLPARGSPRAGPPDPAHLKRLRKALYSDPKRPPPRPPFHRENIPAALAALPQFVCWAWEWDRKRGEWTKVPIDPKTGRRADTADPATWGTLDQAAGRLGKNPKL